MALNKFMHQRNRYRRPPDFKVLAIKHPEFRKYAKQDISGKVSLNFKDLESIRALTCTLLKEDFGLDVEIPLNRLIPTLPLRLNYLLWIEDLLEINKSPSGTVKGIDIGCGASCVYPLLAARQFRWHMLATEVDPESAAIASNNVSKNQLQDMITVQRVEDGTMLDGVLDPNTTYDFCLCNPPFFSCVEELDPQHGARSLARHPPRNAPSGTPSELVVPGGEIAFVSKIVQDSVKLKKAIRIYSVMLGHKSSVGKVKQVLEEAGVRRTTVTEFCQGRTTRWGIAWTLDDSVELAPTQNVPLSHKKKVPFSHITPLNLVSTVEQLKKLLVELQMTHSILKNNQEICAMEITAMTNTWSNSRKKRRQEKLKQKQNTEDCSSIETKVESSKENIDLCKGENDKNETDSYDLKLTSGQENNPTDKAKDESSAKEPEVDVTEEKEKSDSKERNKRSWVEETGSSNMSQLKRFKADDETATPDGGAKKEPLLCGSLVVKKSTEGSTIELCWVRGAGGRDAAHQVLQYFKNNLKTH